MVSIFPHKDFVRFSAWMEKGIRLSGIGSTQHDREDELEDDLSWIDSDAASVCWGAIQYIQIAHFSKKIDFIDGITWIWCNLNPVQLIDQVWLISCIAECTIKPPRLLSQIKKRSKSEYLLYKQILRRQYDINAR